MSEHPLVSALVQAWPPDRWREVSVLVAVSGGPDSVALLTAAAHLAKQIPGPGRLIAAHYNHRLRPTAQRDEDFVRQLCRQLAIPLEVGTAEAGASPAEEATRSARYAFLQSTAERLGARYVALGHTADDQAETVLHRILRGTGLKGLSGMPRARSLGEAASLIRPLLACRRADVLAYLASLQQDYCHDETNDALHYTRNRIRGELLPLLEAHYNPEVRTALLRLAELAGEASEVIDVLAADLLTRHVPRSPAATGTRPAQVTIACDGLERAPMHVVCEMFVLLWTQLGWPQQGMNRAHWQQLAAAAQALFTPQSPPAGQRFHLPGAIEALRQGDQLTLLRASPAP